MAYHVVYINLSDLVEGFLTWRFVVRERVSVVLFVVLVACFGGENGNNLKSGVLFCRCWW